MPAWKDMTPEQREERVAAMKEGKKNAAANPKPRKPKTEPVEDLAAMPMVTLSAEEIADIRRKAVEELTKEKKKELIAAELIRQKRLVATSMGMPVEPEPEEPQEYSFMPQLAEYTPALRIDGRYYFHGVTHHGLDKNQYDHFRWVEGQTWTHQATIDGKRQNYYNANSRLWQTAGGGAASGSTRHVI